MAEELLKKLNTAGAFDTPWLKEQLQNWSVIEEQKKTDFMEHLYQVYKPANHCYTGLWERFCVTEAGPIMRERYFEMLAAIKEYEENVRSNNAIVAIDSNNDSQNLHESSNSTYKIKATEYFTDTIAEFFNELSSNELFECFLTAANNYSDYIINEHDKAQELISLVNSMQQ